MSAAEKRPPAILSISSHVARGSVGNRGIVFALETLGFAVWSVNTVSLPYHPGHGKATRLVPDHAAFEAYLDDLLQSPWIGEVGGVLTGYMADAAQAEIVGRFVAPLKARHPGVVALCDPVIGDHGGLYVSGETAEAIRDHLLAQADIATPNVHELAWLAGEAEADDAAAVVRMARALGSATVIATSAPAMMRGHIGNLLVSGNTVVMAEHRLAEGPPNGPGDLFSGLYLAHVLMGEEPVSALERATGSVFEIVTRAAKRGASELMLATDKGAIVRPMAMVNLRSVVVAKAVAKPKAEVRSNDKRVLAGVDGCRAGWIAVYGRAGETPETQVFASFPELLEALPEDAVIAVDMPIGLPERTGPGGRGPEQAIRPNLGMRQSSVFSIPSRSAIYAPDYGAACAAALATSEPPRKVSRQAFGIFPKIREIDALMTRQLEKRVYEVHPELAFWRLNGGQAMALPKKIKGRVNPEGMRERIALLESLGFPSEVLEAKPPRGAASDDLLDACACHMIAQRLAAGIARPFPDPPATTETGARMAIWA